MVAQKHLYDIHPRLETSDRKLDLLTRRLDDAVFAQIQGSVQTLMGIASVVEDERLTDEERRQHANTIAYKLDAARARRVELLQRIDATCSHVSKGQWGARWFGRSASAGADALVGELEALTSYINALYWNTTVFVLGARIYERLCVPTAGESMGTQARNPTAEAYAAEAERWLFEEDERVLQLLHIVENATYSVDKIGVTVRVNVPWHRRRVSAAFWRQCRALAATRTEVRHLHAGVSTGPLDVVCEVRAVDDEIVLERARLVLDPKG